MAATHKDDLDLLLSLQDRVLETPPTSPSSLHPPISGYTSDDETPNRVKKADMSAFKDAVSDYLINEPTTTKPAGKKKPSTKLKDVNVENFSGFRIENQLFTPSELSNLFSDTRFVRLPAIGNSLVGDSISGHWVTVGVLTEKGYPKVSSTGKSYCIWKMGCLNESTVSVFLFGDAYAKNCNEPEGTVFALLKSGVRKDAKGKGFCLSVFSCAQILKMGTSVDYGVCKGRTKDGMACTIVINKCRGTYCRYHTSKATNKYVTMRSELKGGNLRTAFRDPLKSQGIYLVDPLSNRTNLTKPVKVLSVDGLKKALSNAGKVTTNSRSQGIRFLTEVTEKMYKNNPIKGSTKQNQQKESSEERYSSAMKVASRIVITDQEPNPKRVKTQQASGNMIELDIVSSEGED